MTIEKKLIIVSVVAGVVAGVAIVTSVWSLFVRIDDLKVLNEIYDMMLEIRTDLEFSEIVEKYDED